ncbi:DUF4062 domain-containing protein [Bacillus sp. JJ1566]|uniref:DUF4062 domain-containing protein n=1 Tax=Bacillus sp. JJ1566 TaxID=3122961 RepID=UPI00300052EE
MGLNYFISLVIEIVEKKLQVFVSSIYLDLKNERQKAVEGILRSKHIPVGIRTWG